MKMIYFNIPNNMPKICTYIISEEERQKVINRRNAVLTVLKSNIFGLTTQEIANKVGYDIRSTQAILTVLAKNGEIITFFTENGRMWRVCDKTLVR